MILADRIPNAPGVYQLFIHLPQAVTVQIGKLGIFTFPAGQYVYTGSAMRGLQARISRHLRSVKRRHWHIDHLLAHAQVTHIRYQMTTEQLECVWNSEALSLPNARVVTLGFGSSDCRCPSHLVYVGTGLLPQNFHDDAKAGLAATGENLHPKKVGQEA